MSVPALQVGLLGARGRMGQAVAAQIAAAADLSLAFALDRESAGSDWPAADVVIDFAAPGATAEHAARAAALGLAYVVGTTGLTDADQAALEVAAQRIAVLQAGNFSLGVTLLAALVQEAAARLGPDWDIEISETHHRHKVDSPSGTALLLGEAAATGRGVSLAGVAERGRDGLHGERAPAAIGFSSRRAGAVIGEHEVLFACDSERITFAHHAEDRALFAVGAVRAARFAAAAAAGRYSMRDVLGL